MALKFWPRRRRRPPSRRLLRPWQAPLALVLLVNAAALGYRITQGWDCTPIERLYALTPDDRPRLDWYDSIQKGLRIWNFEGTELFKSPAC
jgi:hypothetical protein